MTAVLHLSWWSILAIFASSFCQWILLTLPDELLISVYQLLLSLIYFLYKHLKNHSEQLMWNIFLVYIIQWHDCHIWKLHHNHLYGNLNWFLLAFEQFLIECIQIMTRTFKITTLINRFICCYYVKHCWLKMNDSKKITNEEKMSHKGKSFAFILQKWK